MARAYPVFLVLGLVGGAAGCARTPAAVDPPAVELAEPVPAMPPAPPMIPAPPVTPMPPATPTSATPPAGSTPASNSSPQATKAPAFLDAAAKHDGMTLPEWIARLGDADDLARTTAADAIAKYGPNAKAAVPSLVALLRNPDDLSFGAAVMAIGEIGPAAKDAVDPLVVLLRHPRADVRESAAAVIGQLGPPAGRAVPALIDALDAARPGGEKAQDAFRYPIQELGKYEIRAVFAAARRKKLTDRDLGHVIESLGPDDAHAVAGLTAELKDRGAGPISGSWVIYTLGGLKRIGPKSAPALPAIRELLNDRSPEVRRSAAEAIAAIGAGNVDAPPPPPPRRGGSVTGPDPAVAAVLGRVSDAYRERGYKGVVLGTPFDELAKDKGLKLTRIGQPWAVTSDPKASEEFVFDAGKKLVCYTRSYDGGPKDYLDQVVDLFGESDRPPQEFITTNPTAVMRRTAVDYTFPKVLARVVFVRAAREGLFPGGRPVVEEKTHVAVLDRAWATGVLDANVRGKRAAVGWVRAVGEKVKGGEVVLADLPRLDGAEGREFPKELAPIRFYDAGVETDNKAREKQQQLPALVASVEKSVRPGERRPVVRIHFLFERYTPLAIPAVHGAKAAQRHNPLWYTPFANLVTELNVAVVRETYPPRGGVEYVRPASGSPYYEWRSADGWLVRCRGDDAVTVEWAGEKGL